MNRVRHLARLTVRAIRDPIVLAVWTLALIMSAAAVRADAQTPQGPPVPTDSEQLAIERHVSETLRVQVRALRAQLEFAQAEQRGAALEGERAALTKRLEGARPGWSWSWERLVFEQPQRGKDSTDGTAEGRTGGR